MQAALRRVNREADRVDEDARRDIERRARDARELRDRCAPYVAVLALEEPPAPLPVVGLSELARSVLALVALFVARGAAGVQAGGHDLAWRYACSLRAVWYALAELRDGGWLVVTPDYVPASESKLGGAYVTLPARTRKGRPRSLRSEDPEAHGNSRVRNLYTLGTKAHAAGLGKRPEKGCGQTVSNPAEKQICTATLSALFSGSGDPDRSALFPVNAVENPTVEVIRQSEIDGSASSPRSTFREAERNGVSLLEPTQALDASAPLVAESRGDVDQVGDGDGSEAVNRRVARRGLFGEMGQRLAQFFRRGDA